MSEVTVKAEPGVANLELRRGDDVDITFTMRNKATGTLLVLPTTGWSAQIRKTADSPVVLASFTVDATSGASGVIRVTMLGNLLTFFKGVWDLQCTTGGTRTYIEGDVLVGSDVTR